MRFVMICLVCKLPSLEELKIQSAEIGWTFTESKVLLANVGFLSYYRFLRFF